MEIVEINPFRCRVWNWHSRLDENINEESCKAEIESIARDGQLVPVLGRRLGRGADHDIELIYGARRLFVARCLNRPLRIELRDISDRDGLIAMEMENRMRKDIGAYERGVSYARWLAAGYFASQDEVAAALQLSASRVSRLLRVAQLPIDVVRAFGSAADICEEWGVALANLLDEPQRKRAILQAAQAIALHLPRPAARDVWKQLSDAADIRRRARNADSRIVKDDRGVELFRVKHQRDSILLLLPVTKLSRSKLAAVERAVVEIVDPRNTHDLASFDFSDLAQGAAPVWN